MKGKEQQKILIVDDEPLNLRVLIEGLKNCDYDILAATSGKKALEIARRELPDLILLDIMMPEMDGHQVCKELYADDETAEIPIIFVTALSSEEDEARGLHLGAVDFIKKPIRLPIVQARIATQLVLKTQRDELADLARKLQLEIAERSLAEEQRRRLEEKVRHAQKLESLGILAGGIAHDFNNILMTILGNADLAAMELAPDDPARENLQEILIAAQRAAGLSNQMLAYSGKGRFALELIELNHLIEPIESQLKSTLEGNMTFSVKIDPEVPPFEGDRTQIQQVITSLVANAAESMTGLSGEISVACSSRECDREYLDSTNPVSQAGLDTPLAEGNYVVLEITDSGCGMDRETIDKIFDPFFTTKFAGRGLGLAAVLGIVRGHKGALEISSRPQEGTTFRLLFPAVSSSPDTTDRQINVVPQLSWQESGRILLIDDEASVLEVTRKILNRLGFSAITARDGQQALDIYRDQADSIACVILDLTMPNMDGAETFRELSALNPEVKVILSSGYTRHEVTERFRGKAVAGFLQKPYQTDDLRKELITALSETET